MQLAPLSRVAALVLCLSWLGAGPAAAAAGRDLTVAVLYFDYDGPSEDLGFLRKGLNQMLVTDLVGTPGFTVVERVRLEEVLAELGLSQDRKIDRSTAVKVGKMLGAHYLVMGGYFEFRGSLQVSVRVVDVATSAVVLSVGERKETAEFWALEQALAAELRGVMTDKLLARAEPAASAPAPAPPARARKKARKKARREVAANKVRPKAPAAGRGDSGGVAAVGGGPPAAPPKRPAALRAETVARYGRALDALDRGDKEGAKAGLEAVLEESPDFGLAAMDLASLAK